MADEKDTQTGSASTKAPKAPEPAPEPTVAENLEASREHLAKEREALAAPADIGPASAEDFESSGAVQEPDMKSAIDVDHPAVDNNPRAGTTVRQNQIDFNDPNLRSDEAVAQRLADQD